MFVPGKTFQARVIYPVALWVHLEVTKKIKCCEFWSVSHMNRTNKTVLALKQSTLNKRSMGRASTSSDCPEAIFLVMCDHSMNEL